MSLATLKKKTATKYVKRKSGKDGDNSWVMSQGPCCKNKAINGQLHSNSVGFSINGGHRSISVGKDMKFSNQGTKFRGIHPCGNGGKNGRYVQSQPIFNIGLGNSKILIRGNDSKYIKKSVISTTGMLRRKNSNIYNGQFPNNIVQPNYTGNLVDNASQGMYIDAKSAINNNVVDTNDITKYEDHHLLCCNPKIKSSINNYTKSIYNPQTANQYTLRLRRQCMNPTGTQKPFPYKTQTGSSSAACVSTVDYVAPDWYWNTTPIL